MSLGLAPFAEAPQVAPPVAPSYFASASNPVDNGSLSGVTQVTVTPPASMAAGDLVIAACQTRTLSLTWTVFNGGGQTWNTASGSFGGGSRSMGLFWCQYNGTWAASPVFECLTATLAMTCVMQVFRPDVATRVWSQDVAFAQAAFGAPSGPPYVVTRAGLTTLHSRTVTLACWFVPNLATFANLSGLSWIVTGGAQYRNINQVSSYAHQLNASTAIVPTVSQEESISSVGNTCIMSWYAA